MVAGGPVKEARLRWGRRSSYMAKTGSGSTMWPLAAGGGMLAECRGRSPSCFYFAEYLEYFNKKQAGKLASESRSLHTLAVC